MSDIPIDYRDRLDLAEQVARINDANSRIERQQEETRKFVAEQHKLLAEARKFRWDPFLVIAGIIVAGMVARLPEILHAFGVAR